jgi:hypothetical protein
MNNELIEVNNILVTDFTDIIKTYSILKKENKLHFNMIKDLNGNKELLEKSFKDELIETNYY